MLEINLKSEVNVRVNVAVFDKIGYFFATKISKYGIKQDIPSTVILLSGDLDFVPKLENT